MSGRGLLLAGSAAAVLSVPALAGPQGERVAAGSARFHRDGAHTTIVTSQTAIINYQSFNLRANESVRFVQPDASSRVLNRIRGADPTVINGSVAANGSVYFVNPAGVVFGPNAVLNVGDLFAAAGHITDRDFLAGRDRFTGLTGEVINRGTINALGGAHLLGERVANFGHIIAPDGVITLASGNDVLIGKRGGHVFAKVTSDHAPVSRGAGVTNAGTLDAGSGTIQLGAGDHFALALKKPSELIGGLVMIEGGDVDVAGSIDVSGDATGLGDGGRVTVTGRTVALRGADIDASGVAGGDGGWVRVGGDVQGRGAMKRSGATLVGSGSRIDVSAIGSGDAGSAVVWADGGTLFRGSIDASAIDGRGGFVEVSGKGWLGYAGDVEVASATGRGGTLLLDPKNILIVGAGDTILGEVTLSEQIDSFLDFGIDAGNADAGFADDVTSVLTDATLSSLLVGLNASSGTLILRAENDIVFGGTTAIDINNSAGSSSLDLRALRSIRVEDTMGEPTPASVSIDLGTGRFIARANYRPSGLEIARVSNRDAGDADIRFNDVSSIAAGDVVLQVGSGWNGRQFGGVIVAPEITATGSVLLQNLATRTSGASGGSVLNASAANTITAGRVVIEQVAALGGVVGTPAAALTLDTGTLNVAARGRVDLNLPSGATIDSTSAAIGGVALAGGTVTGLSTGGSAMTITTGADLAVNAAIDVGTTTLRLVSDQTIGIGDGTGVVTFDDVELANLTGGAVRFETTADLDLSDAAGGANAFASFGGLLLGLTGDTVSVSGSENPLSADAVSITASTAIDLSGLTSAIEVSTTVTNGGRGLITLTTPQSIGLSEGTTSGLDIDTATLGSWTFGGLVADSTAGDVTLADLAAGVDGFAPFAGTELSLAGGTVTVTGDGLALAVSGLSIAATTEIDLGTLNGSAIGSAGAGLSFVTPAPIVLGSGGGAGDFIVSGGVLGGWVFDSISFESTGGTVVANDGSFGAFGGRSLTLTGAGVEIAASESGVLSTRDLFVTSSNSITFTNIDGLGDGTGVISLTTADSIGLGTAVSGGLDIDGSTLANWDFASLELTSTGGDVTVQDEAGGDTFTAIGGAVLGLSGGTVTVGGDSTALAVSGLNIVAGTAIDLGGMTGLGIGSAGATLSFVTPESVGLGAGAGAFGVDGATISGWTFSELSVESTGGSVEIVNDGALFGALSGTTLRATASGTGGTVLLSGQNGAAGDTLTLADLFLTADDGVTLRNDGTGTVSLALGSGGEIDAGSGVVSIAGDVSLDGTGSLIGDVDATAGTLTIAAGADVSLLAGGRGVYTLAVGPTGLTVDGALRLVRGSELRFELTAGAGTELLGSGTVDAGGGSVSFLTSGALSLGTTATAGADVSAAFLGLVSNLDGLDFASTGGSVSVNGDGAFYGVLTGGGLSIVSGGGAGGGVSFASTDADLVISASDLMVDAGTSGGVFGAIDFGSNIAGVTATDGAGRLRLVGDHVRATRAFTLTDGGSGGTIGVILNTGNLEAIDGSVFDLTLSGQSLIASLDGTDAGLVGGLITIDTLTSVFGGDGLSGSGLSLELTDLSLTGGLNLSGLLSIEARDGTSVRFGAGAGGAGVALIDLAETGLITGMRGLTLRGDSVFVANDVANTVFGMLDGEVLTLTADVGDVSIFGADALGARSLSVRDLGVDAQGNVVFGDFLAEVVSTNSSSIDAGGGLLSIAGSGGAFRLELEGASLGVDTIDAGSNALTFATLVQLGNDLAITAGALEVTEELDADSNDLTLQISSLDLSGSIINVAELTFDAGAVAINLGTTGTGTLDITATNAGDLSFATLRLLTDAGVTVFDGAGMFAYLQTVNGGGAASLEIVGSSGTRAASATFGAGTDSGLVLDGLIIDSAGLISFGSNVTSLTTTNGSAFTSGTGVSFGADAMDIFGDAVFNTAAVTGANGLAFDSGATFNADGSVVTLTGGLLDLGNLEFGAAVTTFEVFAGDLAFGTVTAGGTLDRFIAGSGGDINAGVGSGFDLSVAELAALEALGVGFLELRTDGTVTLAGGTVAEFFDDDTVLRLDVRGAAGGASSAAALVIDAGADALSWGVNTGTIGVSAAEANRLNADQYTLLSDTSVAIVDAATLTLDVPALLAGRLVVGGSSQASTDLLTVELFGESVGFGTGAGDVSFGAELFDGDDADGELRFAGFTLTGATDIAFAGVDASIFGGVAWVFGTDGSLDTLSIDLADSATITAEDFDVTTNDSVTFGQNVSGLSLVASGATGTINTGSETIFHQSDFTYDGTFDLTGNIEAVFGGNEFDLTFQNGTTTLTGAGDTNPTITAGGVIVRNGGQAGGILTSAAGNDLSLSLLNTLDIDASSELGAANGRVLALRSRNADGMTIGGGASGLIVTDAELSRFTLAGRTLELLVDAGGTIRIADIGDSLFSALGAGVLSIGRDGDRVMMVDVSTDTAGAALRATELSVFLSQGGEAVFSANVGGLSATSGGLTFDGGDLRSLSTGDFEVAGSTGVTFRDNGQSGSMQMIDVASGDLSFMGDTVFASAGGDGASLDVGGTLTFAGSADADRSLEIASGEVRFSGADFLIQAGDLLSIESRGGGLIEDDGDGGTGITLVASSIDLFGSGVVDTDGAFDVDGGLTLGLDVIATNGVTFNNGVTVNGAVQIDASDGSVTLNDVILGVDSETPGELLVFSNSATQAPGIFVGDVNDDGISGSRLELVSDGVITLGGTEYFAGIIDLTAFAGFTFASTGNFVEIGSVGDDDAESTSFVRFAGGDLDIGGRSVNIRADAGTVEIDGGVFGFGAGSALLVDAAEDVTIGQIGTSSNALGDVEIVTGNAFTTSLNGSVIADRINIRTGTLEASGGFGDALNRFDTAMLRANRLDLGGAVNGETLYIDRLTAGRRILVGGDAANALSIDSAELAFINGGSSPLGELRVGTMSSGTVQISSSSFNARSIVLGRGDAPVIIEGASGAFGAGGTAFRIGGTLDLENGSTLNSAGRDLIVLGTTTVHGASLVSTGGGDADFGGSIRAGTLNAELNVRSGTGDVELRDVVNDGIRLGLLDVRGSVIDLLGSSMESTRLILLGTQVVRVQDESSLRIAGLGSQALVRLGTLELGDASDLTIDSTGTVRLADVIGAQGSSLSATTTGAVVADGTIGSGQRVGMLSLRGGVVSIGNVFTQSDQSYIAANGTGRINVDGTLDSGPGGSILLDGRARVTDGSVTAQAANGQGGDITFTDDVALVADSLGSTQPLFLVSTVGGTIRVLDGADGSESQLLFRAVGGRLELDGRFEAGQLTFEAPTVALVGDTELVTQGGAGIIDLSQGSVDGALAGGGFADLTVSAANGAGASVFNFSSVRNVGVLDIVANNPNFLGGEVSAVDLRFRPFTSTFGVSVGTAVNGTANLPTAFIASFTPITMGVSEAEIPTAHLVGGNGYAGPIFVNGVTLPASFRFQTSREVSVGTLMSSLGSNVFLAGGEGNRVTGGITSSDGAAFNLDVSGITIIGNAAGSGSRVVTFDTAGGNQFFRAGIEGGSAGFAGARFLTGGGLFSVAGDIGSADALGSLEIDLAGRALTLGNVTTTGSQAYTASDIALDGGSLVGTASGSSISFAGSLTGFGTVDTFGNVNVSGSTTVTSGQTLVVRARGDAALGGPVIANGTLDVNAIGGTARFEGTLTGRGSVIVRGGNGFLGQDVNIDGAFDAFAALLIDGDRSIRAGSINLMSGALAQGGAATPDLSLFGEAAVSVMGDLGTDAARMGRVEITSPVTSLGASVFAQDGVLIDGDAVIKASDVLVRSYDPSPEAGIRFTGRIDGDGVAGRGLTLYVSRENDPGATEAEPSGLLPRIEIFGNVGERNQLGTLALNFSGSTNADGSESNNSLFPGRTFVPVENTIVLGDIDAFEASGALSSLTYNVGTFNVGDREKLFVIGDWNLLATAPNTARLGDVTALGDLIINSPNVVLVAREDAQVFDSTNGVFVADQGTDLVAGGALQVSNVTRIVNLTPDANRPRFANSTGDINVQSSVGAFAFVALADDLASLALADGNPNLSVDVRADGATNTDVAEALAGATPRNQDEADVESDAEIDAAVLATLRELGINAQPAAEVEPEGDMLKVNLPESPTSPAAVSADRLESDIVTLVIDSYRELFLEEQDGQIVNRRLQIQGALNAAVDGYFEETEADEFELEAFITFLRGSDDASVAEATDVLADLQELLTLVKLLGLSSREIEGPKDALFGRVRPIDIPGEDWDALIEGRAAQFGATARLEERPGDAPAIDAQTLSLLFELLDAGLLPSVELPGSGLFGPRTGG